MSVSGVQPIDSVICVCVCVCVYLHIYVYIYIYLCVYIYIYIFFFRFFSIIGYYKILNIVPCATQEVLVVYLSYI